MPNVWRTQPSGRAASSSLAQPNAMADNIIKNSRKVTPRTYIGPGYYHWFENDTTQEIVTVECTQAEYDAFAETDASQPTLVGHTWKGSFGGTTKVDSISGFLGADEYTIKGGEVVLNDASREVTLSLDAVDANDNLDEDKLINT